MSLVRKAALHLHPLKFLCFASRRTWVSFILRPVQLLSVADLTSLKQWEAWNFQTMRGFYEVWSFHEFPWFLLSNCLDSVPVAELRSDATAFFLHLILRVNCSHQTRKCPKGWAVSQSLPLQEKDQQSATSTNCLTNCVPFCRDSCNNLLQTLIVVILFAVH